MMNSIAGYFKAKSYNLMLPREYDGRIDRYIRVHSKGSSDDAEGRPFHRQIDFWGFCIATALARNLTPRDGPAKKWGKAFVYSNQANIMEEELCSLLAIVAVAKFGLNDQAAIDTRQVIELANCLAAVGCREVIRQLEENTLSITNLEKMLDFSLQLRENVNSED